MPHLCQVPCKVSDCVDLLFIYYSPPVIPKGFRVISLFEVNQPFTKHPLSLSSETLLYKKLKFSKNELEDFITLSGIQNSSHTAFSLLSDF